jgi:hypothetical protein
MTETAMGVAPTPIRLPSNGVISMEGLKYRKLVHLRQISDMEAEEILAEYLFLQAGHADEKDRKGASLCRPPHIEQRMKELERHILNCLAVGC